MEKAHPNTDSIKGLVVQHQLLMDTEEAYCLGLGIKIMKTENYEEIFPVIKQWLFLQEKRATHGSVVKTGQNIRAVMNDLRQPVFIYR